MRRHRVLGARLLDELGHAAVVVDLDQAVAARVVDAGEQDGRESSPLPVERSHRGQVDVGEHVAVEGVQAAAVELGLDVFDGPGGAQRLLFDDVAHGQAVALTVADRVFEGVRQIPGRKDGAAHAVARQVLEDVAHERPAHQGHDRFGHARGDRPQAGALAADQDHGLSARRVAGHGRDSLPGLGRADRVAGRKRLIDRADAAVQKPGGGHAAGV